MRARGSLYAGSVPAQMLEFFERNPTEALTYADIADKFDCSAATAARAAARLRSLGKVQSEPEAPGSQIVLIVAARVTAPIKFETLKDFLKRQHKEMK